MWFVSGKFTVNNDQNLERNIFFHYSDLSQNSVRPAIRAYYGIRTTCFDETELLKKIVALTSKTFVSPEV